MIKDSVEEETKRVEKSLNIKHTLSIIISSLLLFLAVQSIFLLTSINELWGINQLHYLPKGLAIFLLIISIVGIFIAGFLKEGKKNITLNNNSTQKKKADNKKNSDYPALLFVIGICGILFLTFQVAWAFLGDGSIFVGYLFNFNAHGKIVAWWTEAAPMYAFYGIFYLKLLIDGKADSFFPFTLISFISGVLFVIAAFKFSKVFDKNFWMQLLIFSLLLSTGGTLFFFGYMETYPLQYGCVMLYCYCSYQYLKNKTNIILPAVSMVLCMIFHLQNILLIPSFIFLFTLRNCDVREKTNKTKRVLRSIIIALPCLFVLYLIIQFYPFPKDHESIKDFFIPLSSSRHFNYTLFSAQHLLDIVNEHFLLAGVALTIIIALLAAQYKYLRFNPFLLFLTLNLSFFEAFLIGGNLVFGMARDWDVCASLGIFITLIAINLLSQIFHAEPDRRRVAIPISIVALCTGFAWVALNINPVSASNRYDDLLTAYTPLIEKPMAQMGYENLRKYYMVGDPEGELRTERKMIEVDPQPVQVQNALGCARANAGRLSEAAKSEMKRITLFIGNIKEDTLLTKEEFSKVRLGKQHTGESITLGDFYENGIDFLCSQKIISYNDALNEADAFILNHPTLTYGYELRGYLMFRFAKDYAGAIPYFKKAVAIDSMHTRSYRFLGVVYAGVGDRSEAKRNFGRMMQIEPDWISGLESHVFLLTNGDADISDIQDLFLIRKNLLSIINSQPESETELHLNEHTATVQKAQKLLNSVEKRLGELQR